MRLTLQADSIKYVTQMNSWKSLSYKRSLTTHSLQFGVALASHNHDFIHLLGHALDLLVKDLLQTLTHHHNVLRDRVQRMWPRVAQSMERIQHSLNLT